MCTSLKLADLYKSKPNAGGKSIFCGHKNNKEYMFMYSWLVVM